MLKYHIIRKIKVYIKIIQFHSPSCYSLIKAYRSAFCSYQVKATIFHASTIYPLTFFNKLTSGNYSTLAYICIYIKTHQSMVNAQLLRAEFKARQLHVGVKISQKHTVPQLITTSKRKEIVKHKNNE